MISNKRALSVLMVCCFALAYHWTPLIISLKNNYGYLYQTYDCCISTLVLLIYFGNWRPYTVVQYLVVSLTVFLWCLRCGPNCPIFLCFLFFFFFLGGFSLLRPPDYDPILYLHLFFLFFFFF